MTISTYAELQTALGSWLHRDDTAAAAPDLIRLGEARLNRRLRLLQMEAAAAVPLASGTDYAALPAGFLDLLALSYDSDYARPAQLPLATLVRTASPGRPDRFAISYRFQFSRPADQAYALTARYRKRWDLAADSTNWLLTLHPDAYLFAALAEAEPFLKNDKRVPLWQAKADQTVSELNKLDQRARGAAPLRVDAALAAPPPYDISG